MPRSVSGGQDIPPYWLKRKDYIYISNFFRMGEKKLLQSPSSLRCVGELGQRSDLEMVP